MPFQAATFARGIVAVSVGNALDGDSPEDGLDPATVQRLDGVLARGRSADQLLRFKLWNQAGTVVYSDDHALIGRSFPIEGDLRSALNGTLTPNLARGDDGEAEHVEDATLGDLIEVYVPLTGAAGGRPTGVAESYLSFAPFEEEVAIADRRLGLVLGGGLLLLLLLLIPIVAGASRRLRRQSATNRHLALHDPLTGLPNRTLFAARVERELALMSAHGRGVAVMLLDLDGFKEINDTLGHSVGDDLLVDVGQRLQRGLPSGGTIARLGGDEFGVVLPAGQDQVAALRVAHDLVATLEEPFVVDGISMGISASVGLAISPEHGDAPSDLIRRADIAMYSAKRSRQGVVVYRGDLDPASRESMQLVADLRRAIADGDLRLHYQPKVDMARRAIRGVEALVRWEHPEQGLLLPGTFVPLAERSELVQPLTAWVIDEAVRQCRAWADDGCHLPVAVNLSQASSIGRFRPWSRMRLHVTRCPPGCSRSRSPRPRSWATSVERRGYSPRSMPSESR